MVSNYLIKKGIPLLSQDEDGFYFSQTQDLANVLNKAPWYVRMVVGEWT
jgi:hypothetical protein